MKVAVSINDLAKYGTSKMYLENGKLYVKSLFNDNICEVDMPLIDIFLYIYNPDTFRIWLEDGVESLFDDNFIKSNVETIVDNFDMLHRRSSELYSEIVFDYCLENRLFDYIFKAEYFDLLLLDKLKELNEDDPLLLEVEAYAINFINNAEVGFYHNYTKSTVFAIYCLEEGRIDLFDRVSSDIKEKFDEDSLKEKYDLFYDFFSKKDDIPDYLSDKKTFFDYVMSKKDFNLLSEFNSELLSDSTVEEHIEVFKKRILDKGYVPIGLRNKSIIMDFLFENKMYESILRNKMIPKIEYFNDVDFYQYFTSLYDLGLCGANKEILHYFLSIGEFKFAFTRFSAELFDLETVKKFPEMFTCSDSFFLKTRVTLGSDVLKYYLTKENFFDTPVEFFSDDDLYNAMVEFPNQMLALILENPNDFRNNYSAFTFLLSEKKFAETLTYSKELFDEELLEYFGDDVLDFIEKQEEIHPCFDNEILFTYALKKSKTSVLYKFNSEYWTDELCISYAKEILSGFDKEFPMDLNKVILFEKAMEFGLYDLASSYNFFTDELIDKYFDDFVYKTKNRLHYHLLNNKHFADLCIKNKIPNIFNFLSRNFITDEVVLEYEDDVIDILNDKNEVGNLFSCPSAFKYAVSHGMSDLIGEFTFLACDEDFIKNNLSLIDSIVKDSLPSVLSRSDIYLKHCIDLNKIEFLMHFYFEQYDNLDDDYLEKLSSQLATPFGVFLGLSSRVLEYFLSKGDYTYINEFNAALFGCPDTNRVYYFLDFDKVDDGKKVLMKYFKDIYLYSLKYGVPKPLKANEYYLSSLLKIGRYELVEQFDDSAWPAYISSDLYDSIVKYIYDYNSGVVPPCLAVNSMLRKMAFDKGNEELFLQFALNAKSDEMLKVYAKKMNLDFDAFKSSINELLTRNDELFNTVLPRMFEKRMEVIDSVHLEKIMLYPELQSKLINMNDYQLKLMGRVFDLLDVEDFDFSGVIVSIIDNLPKYDSLINEVDIDNLSRDKLIRLLTVISRKDNLYGITSVEQLETKKYKEAKKGYFSNILAKIKNNTVSILELKEALLQKKFGLSMEQTEFLVQRYCHSLDSLKDNNFDYKLCTILNEINRIYTIDNISLLKFLYIKSKVVEVDFFTSISLESSIRKEFAKLYSDSLYKVNDRHNISNANELRDNNRDVFDKLNGLSYKDKKIPVYILDGDFRLQIHALGAYRKWSRPDDFKQDWERPKIAYHGICTSYIANNQIANARAKHPILGFDNYSSNSLLCAGNYDLFSDYAINRYDTSMYLPYKFFLPDDMINNTRHTHNEMVLERRSNVKGSTFKRLPNYVVMLVDDINNLDNYEGDLWDEYCQAAHDYDVPIVIVDRLKYAKSELSKIEGYENDFYTTFDSELLSKIIVQFCNNMIGCTCFDLNDEREYHRIFSKGVLNSLVERLFDFIIGVEDKKMRLNLIKDLCLVLEQERVKGGYVPSIDKYISILKNEGISLDSANKNNDVLTEEIRIINEYYYNANNEVQGLIEEEFNNGVSPDIIVSNIKLGVYERRFKL